MSRIAAKAQAKAKETHAQKQAAAREQAKHDQDAKKQYDNYEIALQIMKAKRRNEEAFPSKDIETLVEMAIKVVAANFDMYPDLEGITDTYVQSEVNL